MVNPKPTEERYGQRLVNNILDTFRDIEKEESATHYLDCRGRYLDTILYNMSDREFKEIFKEIFE